MFKPILIEQLGDGLLRQVDRSLLTVPRAVMVVGIVLFQLLLFYAYFNMGPWVPLSLFFILNLYLAAKYVSSEFSYVMAFMAAAGRTYIKMGFYPEDAQWWQGHWQFISSYSLFTLFCYLINSQIAGRRQVEQALEQLSRLSEAVISETDAGVLVLDEHGYVVVANPAAARMLSVSQERLHGNRLGQLGMEVPRELLDAIQGSLAEPGRHQLNVRLGSAESPVWTVASVGRLSHVDKHYALVVLTDISGYKAAQDAAASALKRARQAERELVGIGEEVQQRVGRELHDDLGQHLAGAAFMSEVLFRKLQDAGREEMQDAARVTGLINEAISKTRYLSQGLYPDELKENGLCNMMEKLAASVEAVHQIQCDFACRCPQLSEAPEVGVHLFRIAQEAVNNAIRHGKARHIKIMMEGDEQVGRMVIEDDGCGLGNATVSRKGHGLGMRTMQYRADMIGAQFSVATSVAGGTRIVVEIPH